MEIKRLYIGTDHRGFELKQKLLPYLEKLGLEIKDCGAFDYDEEDDYTDYAFRVAEKVVQDKLSRGLLFCGSGIGMAVAANKVDGIIASQVDTVEEANQDRIEHDSNVLVIAANEIRDEKELAEIIESWVKAEFAKGRHLRRINKIRFYEILEEQDYPVHTLIVPTIFTDNIELLQDQYNALKDHVPLLNFDIAEADFVGTQTLGIEIVKNKIEESQTDLMFSVHLMLKDPKEKLEQLNNLPNVLIVYIHQEADTQGLLDQEWSFQLGLSLNPETQVEQSDFLKYPIVQLMSIIPGAQGNELKPEVLEKVEQMRAKGFKGEIHFDGAVNEQTLEQFITTKPNVLNVGSAIMSSKDMVDAYKDMVALVQKYSQN